MGWNCEIVLFKKVKFEIMKFFPCNVIYTFAFDFSTMKYEYWSSLPSYFSSLEQLHLNKNRIKHVKYPFILPTHGPLDDASAVPFENLQVLLLGMPVVGLFLLLLHKILALFYLTCVLHWICWKTEYAG